MEARNDCPKLPWMIDFHSSDGGKIPDSQLKAAFSKNLLEHLSDLNINSRITNRKLTGIIVPFGETNLDNDFCQKCMEAGMTVAKLKIGDYCSPSCSCSPGCSNVILKIRDAVDCYSKEIGRVYPLAIALEIMPPEIRTGSLKDGKDSLVMDKGTKVSVTGDDSYEEHVTKNQIYIDNQDLIDTLSIGDQIFLNDGRVRLSVLKIVGSAVECIVEKAGTLLSRSSVICPEVPLLRQPVTLSDEINFAIKNNVDIVISDCRNKQDVQELRTKLGDKGRNILIFAQVQTSASFEHLSDIIENADGIILDRRKLNLELPQEKMFLIQKIASSKCNMAGKPFICSIYIPHETDLPPEKTDLSDIANVIIDGTDGIMLDFEIPPRQESVERLHELNKLCREAEAAVYHKQLYDDLTYKEWTPIEPIQAIAIAAVQASLKTNACALFVLTSSGRSAKIISKFRPRCPIVALTRFPYVSRQLHVYRGVYPFLIVTPPKSCWNRDVEKRLQVAMTWGKLSGLIKGGDVVIIVSGDRPGSGFTNSMRIVFASHVDVPCG